MEFIRETITDELDPGAVPQDTDAWRASNGWRQKHIQARLFYLGKRDEILALWDTISKGRELRPSLWHELVNSRELWDMVHVMTKVLSRYSLEEWAHAEVIEEGNEITTPEFENYFLVCTGPQALSKLVDLNADLYTPEYATQRFLATVLIYVFADVYGREFLVHYKSHPDLLVTKNTVHGRLIKVR